MSRTALLGLSGSAVLALALAGCNQTTSPTASAPAATSLSAASGCAAQIGRFRTVIENENRMGQVNGSVYKRVDADIVRAEEACAAGRDAEAERMLAATKARYGYPA